VSEGQIRVAASVLGISFEELFDRLVGDSISSGDLPSSVHTNLQTGLASDARTHQQAESSVQNTGASAAFEISTPYNEDVSLGFRQGGPTSTEPDLLYSTVNSRTYALANVDPHVELISQAMDGYQTNDVTEPDQYIIDSSLAQQFTIGESYPPESDSALRPAAPSRILSHASSPREQISSGSSSSWVVLTSESSDDDPRLNILSIGPEEAISYDQNVTTKGPCSNTWALPRYVSFFVSLK